MAFTTITKFKFPLRGGAVGTPSASVHSPRDYLNIQITAEWAVSMNSLTLSRLDDDICRHPFFSSKHLDDDICRHPKIFLKNSKK